MDTAVRDALDRLDELALARVQEIATRPSLRGVDHEFGDLATLRAVLKCLRSAREEVESHL